MISYRSSVELGITLNPNLSNTFAAKIAPFNAEAPLFFLWHEQWIGIPQ